MLRKTICVSLLALAPVAAAAQTTLTADTTPPGSTPHYIDTTLAAVLDSAGVATLQITEGATLTNSVGRSALRLNTRSWAKSPQGRRQSAIVCPASSKARMAPGCILSCTAPQTPCDTPSRSPKLRNR